MHRTFIFYTFATTDTVVHQFIRLGLQAFAPDRKQYCVLDNPTQPYVLRCWRELSPDNEGIESMPMHEQSSTETSNATNWYALKVFYNRVAKIETLLKGRDIESYIPMKSVEQVVAGHKVRCRKPAISSLMFMRCSEAEASDLQKTLMGEVMVYRNRGERQPAAIPDNEMQMFIRVTSIDELGMEYLSESGEEWTTGDRVRVTGGIFQGAEGYIKRIKGNHRLVVAIEGVIAVATSYIPTCFLEKAE